MSRERDRERRRAWRVSVSPAHGKTRGEIHAILDGQGMMCAICGTSRSGGKGWHGDHDHKTGVFRGVLCQGCNVGLGNFKDSIASLYAAIHYLEAHGKREKLRLPRAAAKAARP